MENHLLIITSNVIKNSCGITISLKLWCSNRRSCLSHISCTYNYAFHDFTLFIQVTFDFTGVNVESWKLARYLRLEFYQIHLTLGISGDKFVSKNIRFCISLVLLNPLRPQSLPPNLRLSKFGGVIGLYYQQSECGRHKLHPIRILTTLTSNIHIIYNTVLFLINDILTDLQRQMTFNLYCFLSATLCSQRIGGDGGLYM